jgi:hypothetical protein
MPREATDLVKYFERTYIGAYKRVGNGQSETSIKFEKHLIILHHLSEM